MENKLDRKPTQIFNMDETGFPLDPAPPLVVAPVGSRHVSQVHVTRKAEESTKRGSRKHCT